MFEALNDWNVWWKDKSLLSPRTGKERESLQKTKEFLKIKEIKLITGVRRSGKSTLFYQIINSLIERGEDPKKILLVNFEDDVLSKYSLKEIVDFYQSNKYEKNDFYLFLDEIHRCREWELFVRKLYDTRQVEQILITDSSSKFVSEEYSRIFTGRNVKIIQYPLSFREYLSWREIPYDIASLSSSDINAVKKNLNEYMEYGGFPEVSLKEEGFRKILLKEYFNDILYKDIIERFNIDIHKARDLALYALSNVGNPFRVRNYSRQTGLSFESIEKYLTYFEEVFFLFRVPKFDYSLKSQQVTPKKIYPIDHGLANAGGFNFSQNKGKIYENIVFTELKRRGKEVYYWKDAKNKETDFLVKENLKITDAINVCYDADARETRKREVDGLTAACKKFKLKKGLIITEKTETEEKTNEIKIQYTPLWKWLLKNKSRES